MWIRTALGLACFTFAVSFAVASTQTWQAARSALSQARRMHLLSLQNRAYEPLQRWRHDERALILLSAMRQQVCRAEFALALVCAGFGTVIMLRKHHRHLYRTARSSSVSFAQPLPSAGQDDRDIVLAQQLQSNDLRRAQYGGEGEDEIEAVLRDLCSDGWIYIGGRNGGRIHVVRSNGTERGDIDFFVRSPGGLAFTIDAKNWNRIITYSDARDILIGRDEINPSDMRTYSLSDARANATYARKRFDASAVLPVIRFTKITTVRVMPFVAGVHVVQVGDLRRYLQKLAGRHDGGSATGAPITIAYQEPGRAIELRPISADNALGQAPDAIGDRCDYRTLHTERFGGRRHQKPSQC